MATRAQHVKANPRVAAQRGRDLLMDTILEETEGAALLVILHGGDRCIEAGLGGFIGQSSQRKKLATIGSD